jgi:transcriptional regulator with XRE-family HTH domain
MRGGGPLPASAPTDAAEWEFLAAVGIRLRLVRVACGLSQREFGDVAGIHRTVVGRIERGEINFGVAYLCRLAQTLGVPASSLLPDAVAAPWEQLRTRPGT